MWHLANPLALWLSAIPACLAIVFLLWRRSIHSRLLLPMSFQGKAFRSQSKRTKWIFISIFLASLLSLGLLSFLVAQPVRITAWTEKWSEGIDIILTVDLSDSMIADDFAPNRITVAKSVIREFIQRRSNDRIGLVVFSGESYTLCPLTRDYDYLLSQVEDIRLSELKQGTAIGMGIANSVARLRYSKSKNRIIILLTDGDSNVGAINPMTAANLARQEGIRVYTIGIGKKNRVIVPVYAKDIQGRNTQLIAQIPSYLNPELLASISRQTGAHAYLARDPGMLAKILRDIDSLEKTRVKTIPREKREDFSYLPGLLVTILLILIFMLEETRFRKSRLRYAA